MNLKTIVCAAALLSTLSIDSTWSKEIDKSQATPSGRQSDRVIRDTWYTMTIGSKVHYGCYNERVELKNGKIFFQSKVWKQEEDYINEEQLGAFAEDTPDLKPLFFNFHSTYRTSEMFIDGTVHDGRSLNVKIRKAGTELPIVKRNIPEKTFFATFFPVWLGKQVGGLKPGQSLSFLTIMEDNVDLNFAPVFGRVRMDKPDEIATSTHTHKLVVEYHDLKSIWWVDASGTPIRIEMPASKTVVEKTTAEKARKFLEVSQ